MTENCPKCGTIMRGYHDFHFELGDVKDGMMAPPSMVSDCYRCDSCGFTNWKDQRK